MTAGKPEHAMRYWRRALIAITATGAVVASFIFLTDLALQTGWPPAAAPLLPLCIDALAAMALTEYRRPGGNRAAGAVAVGAILTSAVGNAASHWFDSGLLEPGWLAVTLVGAVPAVSLGICVHLTIPKGRKEWDTTSHSPAEAVSTAAATAPPNGAGSSSGASRSATPRAGSGSARAASGTGTTRTRNPSRTQEEWVGLIRSGGMEEWSANRIIGEHGGSKPVVLKALAAVRNGGHSKQGDTNV